jgi:hypothetical protein
MIPCLPACPPACLPADKNRHPNHQPTHTLPLCTHNLQYYKYTVAAEGFLTVQACSDVFSASFSIYGNDTDADGLPVVNGLLGCGGDFINCTDPNLLNPDSQLT